MLGRGKWNRPREGAWQLGVRDAPEEQRQMVEFLEANRSSLLVEGLPMSGRTSLLEMLLCQSSVKVDGIVVCDPGSSAPESWSRFLAGGGLHVFGSRSIAEFVHVLGQLDRILTDDALDAGALIVAIDRIDLLLASIDEATGDLLATIIRDGSKRNIVVLATSDVRARLPHAIRSSFVNSYRFLEDVPFLCEDRVGRLLRPMFRDKGVPQRQIDVSTRALGRLGAVQTSELARRHTDFVLFVDNLTHEPISWVPHRNLLIAGGRSENVRTGLWERIGEMIARRAGLRVPALIPPGFSTPEWAVNLLEMASDEDGPTLLDRLNAVLHKATPSADILLCLEYEQIRKRLPGITDPRVTVEEIFPTFARSNHMISVLTMRRFPRTNDVSAEFSPDLADHLWIMPPSRAQVSSGSYAPEFVSQMQARPGLDYQDGHARAVLDSEVYEASIPFLAQSDEQ